MAIQDLGMIPPEVLSQWEQKEKHPDFATGTKKRSTYTFANAELFRPFFDKVISTNAEQAIPWNCIGVKPQTLYVKVCDALKWLCENGENNTKVKYLMLKASYKLNAEKAGIALRRRTTKHGAGINLAALIDNPENLKAGVTVIGSQTMELETQQRLMPEVISWKEDLTSFINANDNAGKKIEFKFDSGMSDKDRDYIESVMSGILDIEYVYIGSTLVVQKIEV